jgi:hypothetical protein
MSASRGGRLQGRSAFRKTRVGLAQRRASSRLVDVRIGDGAGDADPERVAGQIGDRHILARQGPNQPMNTGGAPEHSRTVNENAATKSQRIGRNDREQNVAETPATGRKINNLEDIHCVREAGAAVQPAKLLSVDASAPTT